MSIYSDDLAHIQVIINCRYSVAQMCTCEDMLAHNLGALYSNDVMSYNLLTTAVIQIPTKFFFQLDENVPLDNVEKSLHFFQEIYPKHLGNEKIDHAKLLNNHLKVNLAISDCSDKCDENCYKCYSPVTCK